MDDSQKTQPTQNPTYTSDGAVQNGVGVQNTPAIGSVHREIERPVDYIKPAEQAPVVNQELREIGVDRVEEKPVLDKIHDQIGVVHSGENAEPNLKAPKNITFPLSDQDIERIEKSDDTQSSAYWLSVLIKKVKKALSLN